MSQKPPENPESPPVADPPSRFAFGRRPRTPEEEAARLERRAANEAARQERQRLRREAEAEAERTGVPLPPRRAFIRARTDEELEADRIEDERVAAEEEASLRADTFIWSPKREFPAFLRKVREAAKVSLRQAAPALGMSAAYLSRLETGGPARQPSLDRLNRMAALYNVDRHVMYEAAGVHVELPENYDMLDWTDDEFESVMMDPALQPGMMTHEALNYFSPRMKRQILEFAQSLVAQDDPAAYLVRLLQKAKEIE